MIINSIIGSKKSSNNLDIPFSTPYTDFVRAENEEFIISFDSNEVSPSNTIIGFFLEDNLIKYETLQIVNAWDMSEYLIGPGPKLFSFRVVALNYHMYTGKADFRVIYDYKDFQNMVFSLTQKGNLRLEQYTENVINNKIIDIFRYGYLEVYGIKLVTEIGNTTFGFRNDIQEIILPETISRIGNSAFTNCSQLSSIKIYSEIPPILESVDCFYGTESLIIQVPLASVDLYLSEWAGKITIASNTEAVIQGF